MASTLNLQFGCAEDPITEWSENATGRTPRDLGLDAAHETTHVRITKLTKDAS